MRPGLIAAVCIIIIAGACNKNLMDDQPATTGEYSMNNLQVDRNFTFKTSKDISIDLQTLDNNDRPIPGIRVNILTDFPEHGGKNILSFITNGNGSFRDIIRLPVSSDSLVIETNSIGFIPLQKRKISGQTLSCKLGGKNQDLTGIASFPRPLHSYTANRTSSGSNLLPIGSYNSVGTPSYLINPNEIIDASIVADLNAALPEHQSVVTNHPAYLTGNQASIDFQQTSNVFVTFIHEGSSYKNILGYYKYNTLNPPASPNNIDTIYAAWPNVKYINAGGGLVSGNKIQLPLGTFQPGTSLGFVLITDGFVNGSLTLGNQLFYSNPAFNPESNTSQKQHSLLLKDVVRNNLILSFEDTRRDGTCDNDFNDAIFFINADPAQSIVNRTSLPAVDYAISDADGDGIADNIDDYPNDPLKAFDNFYPSEGTYGTLAFEDLWPSKGDYDFNDMILDYNFNTIRNAQNMVTQINASITLKAIGASFHNGFGFQLPLNPGQIASVSGTSIRSNMILQASNGTEANQTKATIIVFDDAFNELPWPGGTSIGVNTTLGATYVTPKTFNITINLSSPINSSALGLPPYNPFIFVNKDRTREVHLINDAPTDLAGSGFLGTQDDNSNPSTGRYYVTSTNLPFAINIFDNFDYPIEKSPIIQAHLKFFPWAGSSGTLYSDWYSPKPEYRNPNKIFSH